MTRPQSDRSKRPAQAFVGSKLDCNGRAGRLPRRLAAECFRSKIGQRKHPVRSGMGPSAWDQPAGRLLQQIVPQRCRFRPQPFPRIQKQCDHDAGGQSDERQVSRGNFAQPPVGPPMHRLFLLSDAVAQVGLRENRERTNDVAGRWNRGAPSFPMRERHEQVRPVGSRLRSTPPIHPYARSPRLLHRACPACPSFRVVPAAQPIVSCRAFASVSSLPARGGSS